MPTFKSKLPNQFDLPRRINRLAELSYNLWWVWNPVAQRLFNRLDNNLWERVNHNPIRWLREIPRPVLNAAAQDPFYLEQYDRVFAEFDAYLNREDTWYSTEHPEAAQSQIAYFSMEFGLHETLPIYSGGLGVLSGDHLKETSDLGMPLVGVGLLYTEGYFSQRITEDGWQEAINNPLDFANLPLAPVLKDDGKELTIQVDFPDGPVFARIWEVRVGRTPLYLLDTNMDVNNPTVRQLTTRLYWSDINLRILQEVVLGVGGMRALRALGFNPTVWHMNEGHAAFMTLERARELVKTGMTFEQAIQQSKANNIFTTHTPVPAGNDEFPLWLIDKYLASLWPELGLNRDLGFTDADGGFPEKRRFGERPAARDVQRMLAAAGSREIVLIGHDGHPEVLGTMGQLPDGAVLVSARGSFAERDEANPHIMVALSQDAFAKFSPDGTRLYYHWNANPPGADATPFALRVVTRP